MRCWRPIFHSVALVCFAFEVYTNNNTENSAICEHIIVLFDLQGLSCSSILQLWFKLWILMSENRCTCTLHNSSAEQNLESFMLSLEVIRDLYLFR